MNDSVFQFRQLAGIPAVGGSDQISGDALEGVDVFAVAMRAFGEIVVGILKSAVEAAVAVVVYASVADIVFIHEVHNLHDGLGIMSRVSVNLHVEDMTGILVLVVRALDSGLVLRCTVIVNRNVA